MYLITILLPLLNFLALSFFTRFLGYGGISILSVSALFFSMVGSWFIFYQLIFLFSSISVPLGVWFELGSLQVNWEIFIDPLGAVMLVVISTVSFFVHLYSLNYMEHDPHFGRFMAYLSLFTFFMFMLVTAANLVQLFFGWEGVGLMSYLLINFWHTRLQANKSALKAILVNRIGDAALLLAFGVLFCNFKTIDLFVIFSLIPSSVFSQVYFFTQPFSLPILVSLLLFIGAVGKSAQLGLHTWLPDAMEGPTPVSALIHAATMVTAGVFLIVRMSIIFEHAPLVLCLVAVTGGLTAIFAGSVAIFQNDIKRVIAYSTCSQLGYMVFTCGISAYGVAMFHLFNHAFFKALLFLGAGAVIHSLNDEQDMRRMGGLVRLLPVTYLSLLTGSLALLGFPFFSGFYSKDYILENAQISNVFFGDFVYYLGIITAIVTTMYSTRLLYLSFFGNSRVYKSSVSSVHEAPLFMLVSFFGLFVATLFSGYLFQDLFIGTGNQFWNNSIFISFEKFDVFLIEFNLNFFSKLLPICFMFLSLAVVLLIYIPRKKFFYQIVLKKFHFLKVGRLMNHFFNKKWYFDGLFNRVVTLPLLQFGYYIGYRELDKGWIEFLGPRGLASLLVKVQFASTLQTGYLFHYILFIVCFSFVMITFGSFFSAEQICLATVLILAFFLNKNAKYSL